VFHYNLISCKTDDPQRPDWVGLHCTIFWPSRTVDRVCPQGLRGQSNNSPWWSHFVMRVDYFRWGPHLGDLRVWSDDTRLPEIPWETANICAVVHRCSQLYWCRWWPLEVFPAVSLNHFWDGLLFHAYPSSLWNQTNFNMCRLMVSITSDLFVYAHC